MKALRRMLWQLLALACLGICESVNGQTRQRTLEEPRWMTLNISESSVGVFAEGRFEKTKFDNTGDSISYNHMFVGPSMGVNMNGSIYHPNLFRFQINTEGAYGWGQNDTGSQRQNSLEYLGRFDGTADILADKSYNAHLFGNYDHTYRDYDFFNRVTVDTFRYGGQLDYGTEPFTASVGYARTEEDDSGAGSTHTESDVITASARNNRDTGTSALNYTYSQYSQADFGVGGNGNDHTISLSDGEKFGAQEQIRLNSGTSYSRRDSFDNPNDDVTANANLAVDHRPDLSSQYDLAYNRYSSGSYSSDIYTGLAQLRHQLYESLTSTLIAQGSDNETSDSMNSGYIRRFGGGFSEAYTKHIGDNNTLDINNALIIEHVDQDTISSVENERHAFSGSVGGTGSSSFFLNLPNVIESTIGVTDAAGTRTYVRDVDYTVNQLGSRTIIERTTTSRIPDGSTVLVDYETESTTAGTYETLTEVAQIRLNLWKNFWGIYARFNVHDNNASPEIHVVSLTDYVFGTEVTWHWLRTGGEYEIYQSDESDFTALRLFQSFSFQPDSASSIGFEFSEAWAQYQQGNRQEENYRFLTLYHRNLASQFRLDFDGGIFIRNGNNDDQTLATVRPAMEYVVGKTTIKAGYDYQYQLFLNQEERISHFFYLRVKRVF